MQTCHYIVGKLLRSCLYVHTYVYYNNRLSYKTVSIVLFQHEKYMKNSFFVVVFSLPK